MCFSLESINTLKSHTSVSLDLLDKRYKILHSAIVTTNDDGDELSPVFYNIMEDGIKTAIYIFWYNYPDYLIFLPKKVKCPANGSINRSNLNTHSFGQEI